MNGGQTNAPGIAIDVKGLTKSFNGREVVHDLSMQVKRGSIYGFLGPNGSGKTTTIRILCGLLTPDSGEGTCLGYDIRRDADKIKRKVGYMTQRFSLYQDLSVRENLEFVARLYGVPDARGAAAEMIARIGLKGREEQLAANLSGGWKQRLALGACTLPNPQLLLLDEPTAGVNPALRLSLVDTLHEIRRQGVTLLVVEHDMGFIGKLCDRCVVLDRGTLIANCKPSELLDNSEVVEAYLGRGAKRMTAAAGADHVA